MIIVYRPVHSLTSRQKRLAEVCICRVMFCDVVYVVGEIG